MFSERDNGAIKKKRNKLTNKRPRAGESYKAPNVRTLASRSIFTVHCVVADVVKPLDDTIERFRGRATDKRRKSKCSEWLNQYERANNISYRMNGVLDISKSPTNT